MPRQNRVTPFGAVVAIPERGTVMGNRGVLHDAAGTIRRAWQLRRWILCRLEFNGRKRVVMSPGRYTELFFLDEATALAAGHRPCAECLRNRFRAFCAAWAVGNHSSGSGSPKADAIDDCLHAERVGASGENVRFKANIGELPDGVFVTLREDDETAYLLWHGQLFEWSAGGYRNPRPVPKGRRVSVLTPASTVAAIRAGYVPGIHPSAAGVPA